MFVYSKVLTEFDMSENIKRMIKNAFELEGLLLLADERGDEATALLFDAIREKAESLATDAKLLEPVNVETPDEPVEKECPEDDTDGDVLPENESLRREEELPEENPEDDSARIDAADGNIEVRMEAETASEPEISDEKESVETDRNDASKPEESAGLEDEKITLDEAFIRSKSKDLHGAFSLNDMFRFRRELFGNSAAEMSDAIELVSAMSSYQEAEDYFYNDLGWDRDSEEAEEFMTIIRNHFR